MYAYNLILLDCRKSNKLSLSRKNKSLIAEELSLLMPVVIYRQDSNVLTTQLQQLSHVQTGPCFFPHI